MQKVTKASPKKSRKQSYLLILGVVPQGQCSCSRQEKRSWRPSGFERRTEPHPDWTTATLMRPTHEAKVKVSEFGFILKTAALCWLFPFIRAKNFHKFCPENVEEFLNSTFGATFAHQGKLDFYHVFHRKNKWINPGKAIYVVWTSLFISWKFISFKKFPQLQF